MSPEDLAIFALVALRFPADVFQPCGGTLQKTVLLASISAKADLNDAEIMLGAARHPGVAGCTHQGEKIEMRGAHSDGVDRRCVICGSSKDTRPYLDGDRYVCWDCAQSDGRMVEVERNKGRRMLEAAQASMSGGSSPAVILTRDGPMPLGGRKQ